MMSILAELRQRFTVPLRQLTGESGPRLQEWLQLIRPSQEPRFADYQANVAMPLARQLGRPPREIAQELIAALHLHDLCEPPEVAGPGFINLKLARHWLVERLQAASCDSRLGVAPAAHPRTYVVDYSSPNVAKPMHVGHIRSTVIGDSICRTLRFLGHRVLSDNHLGDWGTQFGMIIYGFKHFVDRDAYASAPVAELGRLYKLVNRLVDYYESRAELPQVALRVAAQAEELARLEAALPSGDAAADKKTAKAVRRQQEKLQELQAEARAIRDKIESLDAHPQLSQLAAQHPRIGEAVLEETARLHAGDAENRRLWEEFLPKCRVEIERIYRRLGVSFDYEYGESFYQDRLAEVVTEFQRRNLAVKSDGADCVFLDGFDSPMIIRKRDGAFLYATTDLATIQYRMEQWKPDEILYVVDHRQSEHFEKLFAAARLWGYDHVQLRHIQFGTVLGKDGKPYRTRAGDTIGLEGLLDEAVRRALAVVSENDDAKPQGAELAAEERARIAQVIGHAAIKYADLSHHRTSDYEFDEDKMVAMQGNTATYMQYSYARVNGIFQRGSIDVEALRQSHAAIELNVPEERALALELLRFADALADTVDDFRPNQLTQYLFQLTKVYFAFYESCPVLKADTPRQRDSRMLLCDLTARTIRQGLELLGIDVVQRM